MDVAAVNLYGSLDPLVMETAAIIAAEPSGKYKQHWNEYTKNLGDKKSDYIAASQEYWTYINAWLHLFPELGNATEILFIDEIPRVEKMIDAYWLRLLEKMEKSPSEWPTSDFKDESASIRTNVLKAMMTFVDDHFRMVFNVLFNRTQYWKMPTRENIVEKDVVFDMLTSVGVIQTKGTRTKRNLN